MTALIPQDPYQRTEVQWRKRKHRSASTQWHAQLHVLAKDAEAAFPALGRLLVAHGQALFELNCAVIVEDDLGECVTVTMPYSNAEIAAKIAFLRHPLASEGERLTFGRYLRLLGERDQWWASTGAIDALVYGLQTPSIVGRL